MTEAVLRTWSLKALWRRWRGRRATPALLQELTRIDHEEAEARLRRLEAELAVHRQQVDGRRTTDPPHHQRRMAGRRWYDRDPGSPQP